MERKGILRNYLKELFPEDELLDEEL